MDPVIGGLLGAGISGASNILGGLFGDSAADQAWKRQKKLFNQQMEFSREQLGEQKRMFETGVQTKVKDAQAAGIHPIYALGAPNFNFSPVGVGELPQSSSRSGLGEGLANAGSSIGSAIAAASSSDARNAAMMSALQLENQGLQNDLLRTQIRRMNSPGSVAAVPGRPRFPGSGSGNESTVLDLPFGFKLKIDPKQSDMQKVQNTEGEAAEWLLSIPHFVHNLFYTYGYDPSSWGNALQRVYDALPKGDDDPIIAFGRGSTKRGMSIR